jgi:hypothetical protein
VTWEDLAQAFTSELSGGFYSFGVTLPGSAQLRTVFKGDDYYGESPSNVLNIVVPSGPVAGTRAASLSITSNRTTSTRGRSIAFSGIIKPNVPNNTHVTVWMRSSTSEVWTLLSTRHTSRSHHWSYTLSTSKRAHGTYYVQVRYAGSATNSAATSASRVIFIK